MESESEFHAYALDKMFRMVGFAGYDKDFIDSNQFTWTSQRSWSIDEQTKYRLWYVNEHKKAFNSSDDIAYSAAGWFLYTHGWRVNYDK